MWVGMIRTESSAEFRPHRVIRLADTVGYRRRKSAPSVPTGRSSAERDGQGRLPCVPFRLCGDISDILPIYLASHREYNQEKKHGGVP